MLLFSKQISELMGYRETPQILQSMQRNQMQIFLGLFLLSSVVQNFRNTGAFEISVNGKRIYSKLETGRMPTLNELMESFEKFGLEPVEGNRIRLDQHI